MTGLSVVLLTLAISFQRELSPPMTVVALGQLPGPLLRQMPRTACGPYVTFAPMDKEGTGLVYFGIAHGDWRKYDNDPGNDHGVVWFLSSIIRPRLCEECQTPIVREVVNSTGSWAELLISRQQLELSPCLKKLKVQK